MSDRNIRGHSTPKKFTKLSELPNPYDFAHPVTQSARFAGRNKELEDIQYYLRLAKQIPQPVNLALIGERASGKTSLLNIIEIEARQTGLLTARINLNTADAEPISLFWKIYDSVVETAITAGYLFKPGSDEDIIYRRIIDGLDPTADCPDFPLRFPAHYAASVAGGRLISETKLQRDLSLIHDKTQTPCVLLFDECNVLTKNRVALEMLRNVFMSSSGYLLVLTGTPTFFPLLDDVFSPIIRQFKKVLIIPFSDRDETEECIRKPLNSLPLNPRAISPRYLVSSDVHALSGGRPYEIQLLCHFMFRRVQEKRAQRMQLTADVIDDVLRELENTISQEATGRPIISAARKMNIPQLKALKIFSRSSGHATLEQTWFMYVISSNPPSISYDELAEALPQLVALGLININDDGKISFAGDEFEQTYIRYHAERAGVGLAIRQLDYARALALSLDEALESFTPDIIPTYPGQISPAESVSLLLTPERGEITEAIEEIYGPVREALACGRLVLVKVTVTYDGVSAHAWLSYPADTYTDFRLNAHYAALSELVHSNKGELSLEEFFFDLPPEQDLLDRILASSNARLVRGLGQQHVYSASNEYIARKYDDAITDSRRAIAFPLEADESNTVGYIQFAVGDRGLADGIFANAVELAISKEEHRTAALALYNRAVAHLMDGNRVAAIQFLELAREQLLSAPGGSHNLRCLFVPAVVAGKLVVNEIPQPDLSAATGEALTVLNMVNDDGTVPELHLNEHLDDEHLDDEDLDNEDLDNEDLSS